MSKGRRARATGRADAVGALTETIRLRLREFGFLSPSGDVIRELVRTAYFASLKREEGRFIHGSLTYANPARPDVSPPFTRRADYPSLNKLSKRKTLSV